ncbi:hypothetical protein BIW11_12252, partial [Tropilaelaps mercedesae]
MRRRIRQGGCLVSLRLPPQKVGVSKSYALFLKAEKVIKKDAHTMNLSADKDKECWLDLDRHRQARHCMKGLIMEGQVIRLGKRHSSLCVPGLESTIGEKYNLSLGFECPRGSGQDGNMSETDRMMLNGNLSFMIKHFNDMDIHNVTKKYNLKNVRSTFKIKKTPAKSRQTIA